MLINVSRAWPICNFTHLFGKQEIHRIFSKMGTSVTRRSNVRRRHHPNPKFASTVACWVERVAPRAAWAHRSRTDCSSRGQVSCQAIPNNARTKGYRSFGRSLFAIPSLTDTLEASPHGHHIANGTIPATALPVNKS